MSSQQDQTQTVTREATEVCGPSLGKGASVGRVIRNFHVRSAFSTQANTILGSDILDAQEWTNDRSNPRDCLQSELPWLCIHLRGRKQALVKLERSRAWFRLRKQQRISMLDTRITTSTQGTPRSTNTVLQTTTRGFAWSHGTQRWTTRPSPRGKRSLALTYRWFKLSKQPPTRL